MRSLFLACVCLLVAAETSAQTPAVARAGRFEIAAGPQWQGTVGMGTADATLTAANGTRFTLFSTSSELARATGVEARVGARLTRRVDLEATLGYAVPALT